MGVSRRSWLLLLRIICVFGFFALVTTRAALAQLDPRFESILGRPEHRNAVIATAQQSTTWIKRGCADTSFAQLPAVRIWHRTVFDAAGRLIGGTWGEHVRASGCGAIRVLNVQTVVNAPNVLTSNVLAPGDTVADPILQKDAAHYVFIAALAKTPLCKQAFIDDTQVIGLKLEHWTVVACGQTEIVEVRFVPSADGGTDIVAHVP